MEGAEGTMKKEEEKKVKRIKRFKKKKQLEAYPVLPCCSGTSQDEVNNHELLYNLLLWGPIGQSFPELTSDIWVCAGELYRNI